MRFLDQEALFRFLLFFFACSGYGGGVWAVMQEPLSLLELDWHSSCTGFVLIEPPVERDPVHLSAPPTLAALGPARHRIDAPSPGPDLPAAPYALIGTARSATAWTSSTLGALPQTWNAEGLRRSIEAGGPSVVEDFVNALDLPVRGVQVARHPSEPERLVIRLSSSERSDFEASGLSRWRLLGHQQGWMGEAVETTGPMTWVVEAEPMEGVIPIVKLGDDVVVLDRVPAWADAPRSLRLAWLAATLAERRAAGAALEDLEAEVRALVDPDRPGERLLLRVFEGGQRPGG